MKLYYSPGACSMAAHIALEEGGIAYETEKVDLSKHETESGTDFYEINPRGYVPTVDTDSFGILTENPAVLTYIADRTAALPAGEELYRLQEWIGFIGTMVHPAYRPLFGGAEGEEKEEAKANVAKKYELTAELMGDKDWLVGEKPTVADNYLFVTTLWADKMGIDLPEKLVDFRARNMEREAVKSVMKAEGLG